ncbi:MAG: type IV pilus modification protein PilV [Acinetobacter bohemicus]|uniref:Type IV pilus modification protein PilV n=1 Tax=Acinetobacter bohemicus ANC 3994 TaxID=1217715 RepID=N8P386_9GAMM|nr:type IV pilus modification protein PilV [Acinetobacter bohemicus]ENU20875.1 type IV pilus modification protein PilV [Acinetobacter bohemicus ANC 3994]
MKTINYQSGVGLIEVLVAMLVLAIGVLGFIALQYRAVEVTLESTYRVQAINIARDLAERVRVNRGVIDTYMAEIEDPDEQTTSTKNCFTENCTTAELADFDVAQVATRTRSVGMTMNVIECQGNSDGRNCVYVAWGDTSATDGTGEGDCTNSTAYNPASTCLIMELY